MEAKPPETWATSRFFLPEAAWIYYQDCGVQGRCWCTSITPIPCSMRQEGSIARCANSDGRSRRTDVISTCRSRGNSTSHHRGTSGTSAGGRRAELSPSAPVSFVDARRQTNQGATAGLGPQPLLLSKPDPHQRRDYPFSQRRFGFSPGLAQACARSRRRQRSRGWNRALDSLGKGIGFAPRARYQLQRSAPRGSLCSGCLSRSGEKQVVARSCSLVADRAFLSRFDYLADGRFAPALSVVVRRPGLFRSTAGSGSG